MSPVVLLNESDREVQSKMVGLHDTVFGFDDYQNVTRPIE